MVDGFADELVRSTWDLIQAIVALTVLVSPVLVVAVPIAAYIVRRRSASDS